ncbi:MAG: Nif3-like dinuclear metal center hexameric protein [Victivallaceae bacterium]|nr:Nif3-like dinuclear metal center hexameric protein [Victivallaceae bacterium]
MTTNDIISRIEDISGHSLNPDEGIHHGVSGNTVNGVTVCWMATPQAIRFAGKAGYNLLICHESLYYPYDVINSRNKPDGWENWQVNRQRKELLEKYDLSCLRVHGSADEISILDTFAEDLGLGKASFEDGFVKVFDIPQCSLGDLIERVKERMGMSYLRVSTVTDLNQKVSRVGLPWGGLGLFVNVGYQQDLLEQNCDVFIAGESDNYGFRFAKECGIPMIETSHEISENNGLRKFAAILVDEFPELKINFYENKCAWNVF